MGAFVGREAELRTIVSVVAASRKEGLARALEIVGPSGVGKTALAQAVEAHAAESGWLIAAVVCHRIQSGLPYLLVRRLITATIAALGEQADRYTAGLRAEIDASEAGGAQSNEELFLRLLEGVTLDHSVLLSIDDVQWGDAESRSLIERTLRALANRSVVLLSTLRPDELDVSPFESRDVQVALGELTPQASAQLARAYLPDAPDTVITSIVEHAGGRAVDLVALANMARECHATKSEDVAASMRGMVAQDVGLLTKDVREFLQLCALIAEPIELSILQQLWPEERTLLRLIERASGRYLVQHGESLQFAHAAIAQAIRETIPIEIPFRRRIIDALGNLSNPSLEDFERMAEQAKLCGDRILERSILMRLSGAAERVYAFGLVVAALERALLIGQPEPRESIHFFTRLTMAYNYTGNLAQNIRTLGEALSRAEKEHDIDGVGPLVGSLLLALWVSGDRKAAESAHRHYEKVLSTPADRSQLIGFEAFVAMCDRDTARFEHIRQLAAEGGKFLNPVVRLRLSISAALLKSRCGEFEEAQRLLELAREDFKEFAPAHAMYAISSRIITFSHSGPAGIERRFGTKDDPRMREDFCDTLRMLVALAKGDGEYVADLAESARIRYTDQYVQRTVNGIVLTSNVLLGQQIVRPDEILSREAVHEFVRNQESTRLPLVAAWCASTAKRDGSAARALIAQMLRHLEKPVNPWIVFFPIVLVVAAHRAGDVAALALMTKPSVFGDDAGAWNVVQRDFAASVASALLAKRAADPGIEACASRFAELGAPLFERLATGDWHALFYDAATTPEKQHLGIIAKKPTRRELEVASLVSEGITNREIAERLFLSERTIEAHLANLFAKVNVGSRTQLASWYMKTVSPAASS
ncbi:MAG TPA: AAA family ATPase [Candidatus Dormibacteraeota bacterium]|nr:AAA family ATPase [Candidatus Dormibacteraeota bacterium]